MESFPNTRLKIGKYTKTIMSEETIEERIKLYRENLENSDSPFNNLVCTIKVKNKEGIFKLFQDLQLLAPDIVDIEFTEPYKKLIDKD